MRLTAILSSLSGALDEDDGAGEAFCIIPRSFEYLFTGVTFVLHDASVGRARAAASGRGELG